MYSPHVRALCRSHLKLKFFSTSSTVLQPVCRSRCVTSVSSYTMVVPLFFPSKRSVSMQAVPSWVVVSRSFAFWKCLQKFSWRLLASCVLAPNSGVFPSSSGHAWSFSSIRHMPTVCGLHWPGPKYCLASSWPWPCTRLASSCFTRQRQLMQPGPSSTSGIGTVVTHSLKMPMMPPVRKVFETSHGSMSKSPLMRPEHFPHVSAPMPASIESLEWKSFTNFSTASGLVSSSLTVSEVSSSDCWGARPLPSSCGSWALG
mmetsp:Transcript_59128/g.168128  ORF Transcript_59128/g.168128 Transcript_59128/m.168128 type:complete len:258 (+) Transcript_59128:1801-2574(+)